MKNVRNVAVLWIFNGILIAFLIYLLIGGVIKNSVLYLNAEYTKAVIIKPFTIIRYSHFFKYEFSVKGIKYTGSGGYNPKYEIISIGDTVIVVYDKMNPNNNKLYQD